MRKRLVGVAVLGGAFLIITLRGDVVAQQGQGPAAPPRNPTPASMPLTTLQDMFGRFPLPPGQEAYANIDGRHMHQYVVEQAAISRRYRDAGHPKFWGRIIGTSADAEDVEWMIAKVKAAGLSDVRSQPFDLGPQWFPQSWDVSVTGNGKTISLESAQPDDGATGTSAGGMDLDAVYVGLGSEADFVGRDVKGKAMFVFSMLGALNENAVRRADAKGAASIFEVNMLPGNARYQAYRSGTKAPAFTVGHDDGVAARDIIAAMSAGQSARVKVKLDVRRVPNLKTAQIWGTLPGATDERIYIVWGNTYMPQEWYAGGPSRPELEKIATNAFRQFGATMDLYPNPTPPASDMSSFFRFLPGIDTSEFHHYFHTDLEPPQTVPWTGLEASARAYAKIIDEVNKLPAQHVPATGSTDADGALIMSEESL
jgi:hypothetical protein